LLEQRKFPDPCWKFPVLAPEIPCSGEQRILTKSPEIISLARHLMREATPKA
jgi:hypothetical protein